MHGNILALNLTAHSQSDRSMQSSYICQCESHLLQSREEVRLSSCGVRNSEGSAGSPRVILWPLKKGQLYLIAMR